GEQVGAAVVEELTLATPLVLPETGAVWLRVHVGAVDSTGRRSLAVYARAEDVEPAHADSWTRHAMGVLVAGGGGATGIEATEWPPAGATAVDVSALYDEMAAAGVRYGPAFQGLRAAWRLGDEILAEVALPEPAGPGRPAGTPRFGLHPALLDAALH